jgi:hypothetical protein
MHENTSTIFIVSCRRRSSSTLLARLKVDYEGIVDTGAVIMSLASIEELGKSDYVAATS